LRAFEEKFQLPDGFRPQQNVTADAANFRWHVINHNDMPIAADGVGDSAGFAFTGTTFDAAFHISVFVAWGFAISVVSAHKPLSQLTSD
jgi:hypothetical protein